MDVTSDYNLYLYIAHWVGGCGSNILQHCSPFEYDILQNMFPSCYEYVHIHYIILASRVYAINPLMLYLVLEKNERGRFTSTQK